MTAAKTKKAAVVKAEAVDYIPPRLASYVEACKKFRSEAMENVLLFAETYVKALEEFPEEAPAAFANAFGDFLSPNGWERMRMVGKHEVRPEIMLFSDKGAANVLRLPREEQEKVLKPSRTVAVVDPNSLKAKEVKLAKLTPAQENQLIDTKKGRVRSPEEQRKMLMEKADEATKRAELAAQIPFVIEGKVVRIKRGCVLSSSDIDLMAFKVHGGSDGAIMAQLSLAKKFGK